MSTTDPDGGDGEDADENGDNGDKTVPSVDLSLYEMSVSVDGRSSDSVEDVEETARRLMDYLVEQAHQLEDAPDNRGLG
jgi:hypothetical protein